jgi:hypothetical protein
MSNNTSIILGSLIIAAGAASSGFIANHEQQYFDNQRQAMCWDPSVTAGLNGLAAQEALPMLKGSFPAGMSQNDQDAVSKSFVVTLSNYSFVSASPDWGTVNCDATIAYTFTRPDNTIFSKNDGNIMSFELHPGQGGWSYEMSSSDIPNSVVTYVDDGQATGNGQ